MVGGNAYQFSHVRMQLGVLLLLLRICSGCVRLLNLADRLD